MTKTKKVWLIKHKDTGREINGKWMLNSACWYKDPWQAKFFERLELAEQAVEFMYDECYKWHTPSCSLEEYSNKYYEIFEATVTLDLGPVNE